MKIIVIADVPNHLVMEWLKHMKNFAGVTDFRLLADVPGKSQKEIMEMLDLNEIKTS